LGHQRFWWTRHAVSGFDPSKAEKFGTGCSALTAKATIRGGAVLVRAVEMLKAGGNADEVLTRAVAKQTGGWDGGSITLLRPDGSQYPGSPFTSGGLPGPRASTIDGNDNVWISNFAAPNSPITQLCGARTGNCPPGFKTGDQIAPPSGYVGGLQMQTDLAIGPAGDVWVMNNWQDIDSCFGVPPEALPRSLVQIGNS
jgi:hypothetical protein